MIVAAALFGAGAAGLAFRRRPPGVISMTLILAFLGSIALIASGT